MLKGVDLSVREGEVLALVGENGAGKTTLVRCMAGDLRPSEGEVLFAGRALGSGMPPGAAMLWQDVQLCENLDVAQNMALGTEAGMLTPTLADLHAWARGLLEERGVDLGEVSRSARFLSGGQRQMLSILRCLAGSPRLVILDEPTSSLGLHEARWLERSIGAMKEQGTAFVVASHDLGQVMRLADRLAVLRRGRVVAQLDATRAHVDDVAALIAGRRSNASARRQLSRLHGLAGRLASAPASSGISLILASLSAAVGNAAVSVHVVGGGRLHLVASHGLPAGLSDVLSDLPLGPSAGPIGAAACQETLRDGLGELVAQELDLRPVLGPRGRFDCLAVPLSAADGIGGVMTVFSAGSALEGADQSDLLALYASQAAATLERDRLLAETTARNRALETVRDLLEVLNGPNGPGEPVPAALAVLSSGIGASHVGLAQSQATGGDGPARLSAVAGSEPGVAWRGCAGLEEMACPPPACLESIARAALGTPQGSAIPGRVQAALAGCGCGHGEHLWALAEAPGGGAVLVAAFPAAAGASVASVLQDAAHSLRLALEREQAESAQREAAALRRSQELQRFFLGRLSHELRTPLTAIRGYATSLLQGDVEWDTETEQRFLGRIEEESARLGRLVDDLLDFSAIEAGIFRVHPDWCDLRLVIEAAVACLPGERGQIAVACDADLPAAWADHDRMEQVLVNLIGNAIQHNPPGTRVLIRAGTAGLSGGVEITVSDDGRAAGTTRSSGAGGLSRRVSGLGLSISEGIMKAHGGSLVRETTAEGTRATVWVPVEPRPGQGRPGGEE